MRLCPRRARLPPPPNADIVEFASKLPLEQTTNFFSWSIFGWINPLIRSIRRYGTLYKCQLFPVMADMHPEAAARMIVRSWNRQVIEKGSNPHLLKTLIRVNWLNLVKSIPAFPFMFFCGTMPPLALSGILSTFAKYSEGVSLASAYFWVLVVFASQLGSAFLDSINISYLYKSSSTSVSGLLDLLYAKILTLSEVTRLNVGAGNLINLLFTDSYKISMFFQMFAVLILVPCQTVVLLSVITYYVHYLALVPLVFMLIVIPVLLVILNNIFKVQKRLMGHRDIRLKRATEILQGIKIVKLFMLEDIQLQCMRKAREREIRQLTRYGILVALMNCVSNSAGSSMSLICFAFMIRFQPDRFSMSLAYTINYLFNNLAVLLVLLPQVFSSIGDAAVSARRLECFLKLPHPDTGVIIRSEDYYQTKTRDSGDDLAVSDNQAMRDARTLEEKGDRHIAQDQTLSNDDPLSIVNTMSCKGPHGAEQTVITSNSALVTRWIAKRKTRALERLWKEFTVKAATQKPLDFSHSVKRSLITAEEDASLATNKVLDKGSIDKNCTVTIDKAQIKLPYIIETTGSPSFCWGLAEDLVVPPILDPYFKENETKRKTLMVRYVELYAQYLAYTKEVFSLPAVRSYMLERGLSSPPDENASQDEASVATSKCSTARVRGARLRLALRTTRSGEDSTFGCSGPRSLSSLVELLVKALGPRKPASSARNSAHRNSTVSRTSVSTRAAPSTTSNCKCNQSADAGDLSPVLTLPSLFGTPNIPCSEVSISSALNKSVVYWDTALSVLQKGPLEASLSLRELEAVELWCDELSLPVCNVVDNLSMYDPEKYEVSKLDTLYGAATRIFVHLYTVLPFVHSALKDACSDMKRRISDASQARSKRGYMLTEQLRNFQANHRAILGSLRTSDAEDLPPAICNLDLKIRRGELIGICGGVGSGKSSLFCALLGELKLTRADRTALDERTHPLVRHLFRYGYSNEVDLEYLHILDRCDRNPTRDKAVPHIYIRGTVAYFSQNPSIFGGTVRDNICFHKPYDTEKYERIVDIACLTEDFTQFPAGDRTEIGERGATVSGGQKARIALARALYSDADILMLDDPLSAVDAHVGARIWSKCIMGYLRERGATVLLVSHQTQFFKDCDRVCYIKDSRIEAFDTPANLHSSGYSIRGLQRLDTAVTFDSLKLYPRSLRFSLLSSKSSIRAVPVGGASLREGLGRTSIYGTNVSSIERAESDSESLSSKSVTVSSHTAVPQAADSGVSITVAGSNKDGQAGPDSLPQRSSLSEVLRVRSHVGLTYGTQRFLKRLRHRKTATSKKKEPDVADGRLTAEERQVDQGSIKALYYVLWIKSAGVAWIAGFVMTTVAWQACQQFQGIWISIWTSARVTCAQVLLPGVHEAVIKTEASSDTYYIAIYFCMTAGVFLFGFLSWFFFLKTALSSSQKLHNNMISSLLNTALSFFDTTPQGRILNRISKDTDSTDFTLARQLQLSVTGIVQIFAVFLVVVVFSPAALLVFFPSMIIYAVVFLRFRRVAPELRRLEAVTKAPIFSYCSESLANMPTIRAYGVQRAFFAEHRRNVCINMSVAWPASVIVKWLNVRVNILSAFIAGFIGLFSVLTIKNPYMRKYAGVVLSNGFAITQLLSSFIVAFVQAESEMSAVERIAQYSKLPNENTRPPPKPLQPSASWPSCPAGLVVRHLVFRYRKELTPAIKNVSFEVFPGEHVGVVGRTGAGKSSLTVAFLRLCDPEGSSSIVVDGVDILNNVSIPTARSLFSIIPQEPFLFTGTLRTTLCPYSRMEFEGIAPPKTLSRIPDKQLWAILEEVNLRKFFESIPGGLDAKVGSNGDNFSTGQKQLICLARALIRRSRIVILDEATAAVDQENDEIILKAVRTVLKDTTVISIAHRLNTVIDFDRILVMNEGTAAEFDTPANLLRDQGSIFTSLVNNTTDDSANMLKNRALEVEQERYGDNPPLPGEYEMFMRGRAPGYQEMGEAFTDSREGDFTSEEGSFHILSS